MMRVGYAAIAHHYWRHRHQYRLHGEIFIYIVQLILLISLWIFKDARWVVVRLAAIQRAHATTHHQWHHFRRVRNVWRRNDVMIHCHQVAVASVQRVATRRVHVVHLRIVGHVVGQCCWCKRVIHRMILWWFVWTKEDKQIKVINIIQPSAFRWTHHRRIREITITSTVVGAIHGRSWRRNFYIILLIHKLIIVIGRRQEAHLWCVLHLQILWMDRHLVWVVRLVVRRQAAVLLIARRWNVGIFDHICWWCRLFTIHFLLFFGLMWMEITIKSVFASKHGKCIRSERCTTAKI